MKFVVIDSIGAALWHTVEMEDLLDGTYLAKLYDKTARVTPSCFSKGTPLFEIWALTNQLRRQQLISSTGTIAALSNSQIVSTSISQSLTEEEVRHLRGRDLYEAQLGLAGLTD